MYQSILCELISLLKALVKALLKALVKGTHGCEQIVAIDVSWASQIGKHLLRTQNVSEPNQKHFLCPGRKICVRNKCCARGQTGKHLCRQQCVLVCQGLYVDSSCWSSKFTWLLVGTWVKTLFLTLNLFDVTLQSVYTTNLAIVVCKVYSDYFFVKFLNSLLKFSSRTLISAIYIWYLHKLFFTCFAVSRAKTLEPP